MFVNLQYYLFDIYTFLYKLFFLDTKCLFCDFFCFESICSNCFREFEERMNLRKIPSVVFSRDLGKVFFDNLFFLFHYSEIVELIKFIKFEGRIDLLKYVIRFLLKNIDIWEAELITFVPNHNNINNFLITKLLCNRLSFYGLKIRHSSLFLINPNRKELQHLIKDRRKRVTNSRDKFLLNKKENISKMFEKIKRIIIFDDIITTGASLNEVSRLIKQDLLGSIKNEINIDCIVLAKG